MSFSKAELEAMAQRVPFWFHFIDLGEGVVTNGWKSPSFFILARSITWRIHWGR